METTKGITIPAGESRDLIFRLPSGTSMNDILSGRVKMDIEVKATCGRCGSMLVPVGPLAWGCPNEPQWRRWLKRYAHVRLEVVRKGK